MRVMGIFHLDYEACFIEPVPEGTYCGDCWKNPESRKLCIILFFVCCLIFSLTVILMSCYHFRRNEAQE